MARTVIYFQRTIDASHVIPDHPGKCSRLHGHTYRFEVWIDGEVAPDSDGMLVDFFDLKAAIDEWDHIHLNDVVDYVPTAELLAADMRVRLLVIVARRCDNPGCVVRLWETPTAYAQIGELGVGSISLDVAAAHAGATL